VTLDHFSLAIFLLFEASRVGGYLRRARQPMLRGPAWFLSVRVDDAFHAGPGPHILRRYRRWIALPFALDVVLGAAILWSGHWTLLNALVVGMTVVVHAVHALAVRRAEREAREFEVDGEDRAAAAVVLSLAPRRLRDYANATLELLIAVITLIPFGWLTARYLRDTAHADLRMLFGKPLLLLYVQLGILYLKHVVLSWRSAARPGQAAEQLAVREAVRRHHMARFDMARLLVAFCALYWPMIVAAAPEERNGVLAFWLALWILAGLAVALWVESQRRILREMLARTAPVALPEPFLEASPRMRPLCFEPATPSLVIEAPGGLSINLASTTARWAFAYVAGLAALLFVVA